MITMGIAAKKIIKTNIRWNWIKKNDTVTTVINVLNKSST